MDNSHQAGLQQEWEKRLVKDEKMPAREVVIRGSAFSMPVPGDLTIVHVLPGGVHWGGIYISVE